MDLDELARLTSDFGDAADELNDAARRAGQDVPGVPLQLRVGPDPLRGRVERVLTLQEEIVTLLGAQDGAPGPVETVTVGLVVPPGVWQVSAGDRGLVRDRARAALDRAAARLGLVVVTEPQETVAEDERGGVVFTLTAGGRPG
ncbi:hypothetical protein O2W14_01350 [Modestobacter sp. VKM Ac-2986]|uniref:hypothetical protein n=1 Tax=Modestobacter sp. VKM Ac-2986 TaxID=3004140 RepID=UPI0022AAED53|nr:hypothetical protein [Modestobacter sp. VKM Ac-2986]MCZ2827479.1 hypothetical protein [Modestobacter sp. VKM Ac-2986]